MRSKEENEKLQRESVMNNKESLEKLHENQMQQKLNKIQAKMQNSQNAYQRTLNQKVKMAKDSNNKMESVAQRAKQQQKQKIEQRHYQFSDTVKKFHEKLLNRKEILDIQ